MIALLAQLFCVHKAVLKAREECRAVVRPVQQTHEHGLVGDVHVERRQVDALEVRELVRFVIVLCCLLLKHATGASDESSAIRPLLVHPCAHKIAYTKPPTSLRSPWACCFFVIASGDCDCDSGSYCGEGGDCGVGSLSGVGGGMASLGLSFSSSLTVSFSSSSASSRRSSSSGCVLWWSSSACCCCCCCSSPSESSSSSDASSHFANGFSNARVGCSNQQSGTSQLVHEAAIKLSQLHVPGARSLGAKIAAVVHADATPPCLIAF